MTPETKAAAPGPSDGALKAEVLIENYKIIAEWIRFADAKAAANWVMGEVLADAKAHDDQLRTSPGALAQLIGLVRGGTLSHQAAKRVFGEVAERGGDPRNVAEALGLVQVADAGVLAAWVSDVLAGQPQEVARYRSGETKLMQFFLGQVMKASRGKADPKLAQRVLEEKLAP